MNEAEVLLEELIKALPTTKEYIRYKDLLNRLKGQPELYKRVGEFRRRSLQMQMDDSMNAVQANNELQKEFRDLQNNTLSSEFFAAEHQYCHMLKQMQETFWENALLDTDFLEG